MKSLGLLALLLLGSVLTRASCATPLQLEYQIPLGDIRGRIDHLAIDVGRQRLFVAELGNDTVGVLDLRSRRALRTLVGFQAPQGVAYDSPTDMLYVANAGDGSVRLFRGPDLTPAGQIALGDDADNVRVDEVRHRVLVGYGHGFLAVIDPSTRSKIADVRLKGHPESFQLDSSGRFSYVNVPDAREIAIVDLAVNRQTDAWTTADLRANYPMVLDEGHQRVIAVFRRPAVLGVFRAAGGALLASVPTCADADDVFLDKKRDRLYVICGGGFVDVFERRGWAYQSKERIPTSSGARTGLFMPELDRLVVAIHASIGKPAAIWILRPAD
ncbi:MAG TPA: hypothetical protein VJQ47_12195 [Steroidobacteraceae bacterium]|nr:hypothetical protein [Steroidobacteraceae bacterium]